ncbi:MAG: hypothetical protein ACI3ZZ_05535 [Candidatus Aphodosoma sp.]
MKQIPITLMIIILIINIISGLLLSCYHTFNMVLNSIVICIAIALTIWSNRGKIASAFSISFSFIIPFITLIEFIIGLFSPHHIRDNWGIITILCLIAFEIFLIYSAKRHS